MADKHPAPWRECEHLIGYVGDSESHWEDYVGDALGKEIPTSDVVASHNALTVERDDLRTKLRQAVEACVSMSDPGAFSGFAITKAREVVDANANLVDEIEREREAGKETAARDSRTDLCRGMDEHLRKEVRGG